LPLGNYKDISVYLYIMTKPIEEARAFFKPHIPRYSAAIAEHAPALLSELHLGVQAKQIQITELKALGAHFIKLSGPDRTRYAATLKKASEIAKKRGAPAALEHIRKQWKLGQTKPLPAKLTPQQENAEKYYAEVVHPDDKRLLENYYPATALAEIKQRMAVINEGVTSDGYYQIGVYTVHPNHLAEKREEYRRIDVQHHYYRLLSNFPIAPTRQLTMEQKSAWDAAHKAALKRVEKRTPSDQADYLTHHLEFISKYHDRSQHVTELLNAVKDAQGAELGKSHVSPKDFLRKARKMGALVRGTVWTPRDYDKRKTFELTLESPLWALPGTTKMRQRHLAEVIKNLDPEHFEIIDRLNDPAHEKIIIIKSHTPKGFKFLQDVDASRLVSRAGKKLGGG